MCVAVASDPPVLLA